MRDLTWPRAAGEIPNGSCNDASEHAKIRKRIIRRVYKAKNKEHIAAYAKKWRGEHPGYELKWAKNNKDKVSEKQKRYRRKHPVAKLLRFMTWYAVKKAGLRDATQLKR